jgi:hypothetical protein
VVANTNASGAVRLSFFSATALAAGAAQFATITAEVPADAPYGAAHVLTITDVAINEGEIVPTADHAIHVVGYFGDATGNGAYSGLDAQRVARVVVHLDTGFDAYPAIDPAVVADITGNGALSGLDAQKIARKVVNLPVPEIPPLGLPQFGPARTVQSGGLGVTVDNYTPLQIAGSQDIAISQRVDLLAVVPQELGRALGYDREDEGVMDETLPPGTRRVAAERFDELVDDLLEVEDLRQHKPLDSRLVDEIFGSVGPP